MTESRAIVLEGAAPMPTGTKCTRADLACIDVHAHVLPGFYCDALINSGRGPSISSGFPEWSAVRAIEMMDRIGIAAAVNSISQPGVHFGDDAAARRLARRCNDMMAQLIADNPSRFGAFAALPLPDVNGACAEIDYALDELKLDGIGLLASYGEMFISDPEFEPIFAKLDEHAATVFIHPNLHPRSCGIQKNMAAFVMEFPFDTTRAVAGLLFSNVIERFPNIRFILAHAGGALPFLSWRISLSPLIDKRYEQTSRRLILNQLHRCYFELAQASGSQVLSCLAEITSPDHVLFGVDWPYCNEQVAEVTIGAIVDNADYQKWAGVFRQNSLPLFPRLVQAMHADRSHLPLPIEVN
jgi:predicted TIM-barrel fold metal-dependent hydrolase